MPAHVRVVGTGLIGTSLGLALVRAGVQVSLQDPSPTACALARDMGAGALAADVPDARPDVVVVAAPPDVAARVVADELEAHPRAVVVDVASVKAGIVAELRARGADVARYVGSHPMAGRERGGAVAAKADLFVGRPWVVVPPPEADAAAVDAVEWIVRACGADPVRMGAQDHDAAVAAVSHVPQVAASLVAARLQDLPVESVGLAGQGVRDVTRIAASDPTLWTQILAGNARAVRDVLHEFERDLHDVVAALDGVAREAAPAEATGPAQRPADAHGARAVLAGAIAAGNAGRDRLPGKHGAPPAHYATLAVIVSDAPGELARLLAEVGQEGVNLEDLHLEHDVGARVGVAEVQVLPDVAAPLAQALRRRGWTVHE